MIAGVVEVGHVVAVRLFGDTAGRLLSGLIALALVSKRHDHDRPACL
jgi:hypothetical protein